VKRPLAAALVALVALACLAPALAMLVASARGPEGLTLAPWREVLDARQLGLLARSAGVAGGAALLALLWGTGVGYAVWRLRGWRSAALETLACVPLLVPSLVLALAWTFFLGPAGFVARRLGREALPFDLQTPACAAFVLSLALFPCVSILVAQGLRGLDPLALRAARLHAGPWRVCWHVLRPELAPPLVTGALLVFLLALADFGVPSVLMVNVYPIEVFTRFSALLDTRGALASCAPPALLAAGLFLVRMRLLRLRLAPARPGARAQAPDGPPWRAGFALAALALLLAVVLPLAFLLATARGDYGAALRVAGEQVLTSLGVAGLGTGLLLALGLAFAFPWRTLGPRGRALAEAAVLVPLLVPGAAVGLGLVELVTAGTWPFAALYPGLGIVACASAARFVAFPALVLSAGLAGVRPALAAAAAVHGAGPARIAARITAPLLAPALVSAAALSFAACLGELSASVLVDPPGTMTLPVRLASLLHFGKDSLVAALCVMLVGLVSTVLLLGTLIAGRPLRLWLAHADRAP
jgi:iron(III) transport system permease protein